ncbi:hypothetical protein, partial [Sphingomonas montanisoli]|uniref:hypothetical protein n=1 Tax=Sphingomonas montanisoli TaxID=2606412 RepID=UPI0015E18213
VIWLGTNVGASANAMMADLATMVSLVKNGRYLIVAALNYSDASGQSGGANWSIITDFNNQAAALYGTKFLNLRGTLVASGIPGNARDAADAALDVPVSSTRYWLYQGALTAAMDATQTNWSAYPNPGSATVMIGTEILTPTTRSGANVTLGVRGANGSTPAAHPQGALIWTWDTIHQSDRGVTIAAEAIKARLDTLYGASLSYGLDLPTWPGAANDNGGRSLAA